MRETTKNNEHTLKKKKKTHLDNFGHISVAPRVSFCDHILEGENMVKQVLVCNVSMCCSCHT